MTDLSVIIPARNEVFLARTVEDVLNNARADTDVIAICDGYWPDPPLQDRPRLHVVHYAESVGQRAATNAGARLSQAKYVMKLDAHCSVDEGFDAKMIEDMQPDWTMIPSQDKLHAFDYVCLQCGKRFYQGSAPRRCEEIKDCDGHPGCGAAADQIDMRVVWEPKNAKTYSWRFDRDMRFQYWRKHHKRPEWKREPLIETMSCIGACFLIERDRFFELGGMDENHGSWGQFGTELACKAWLSGGKMVTTRKTWYAHLFRTGNFARYGESSFPYHLSDAQQQHARTYSRNLWLGNKWPLAKYDVPWLVERFAPVPDWHEGAK